MTKVKGEKHHNWKGENAKYGTKHDYIKRWYGKAIKCENRENKILDFVCNNLSINYQWAKKKDHEYTKNINDYYQLCASCHIKYDTTTISKKNHSIGAKKAGCGKWMTGRKLSKKIRDKQSKSHLGKKYKPMSKIGRKNISDAKKLYFKNGGQPWNKVI